MIKGDFNKQLLNHAGLSALVGDDIFPVIGGTNQTMPAVMYRFERDDEKDMGGTVMIERYQVSISVVSEKYIEALNISKQVEQALTLSDGLLNGTPVSLCQFEGDAEDFNEELQAYVINLNYTLIP